MSSELIFLPADIAAGIPQRELDTGFDTHLVKPADPAELTRVVSEAPPD